MKTTVTMTANIENRYSSAPAATMQMASVVVLLMAPLTANIVSPMPAAIEMVATEIGVSKRGSSTRIPAHTKSTSAEDTAQINTCGAWGVNGGETKKSTVAAA